MHFARFSLCTTICLQWESEIVAIALMFLAGKLSKFEVQDWQGRQSKHSKWWDLYVENISLEILEDICHQVLDIYSTKLPDSPRDSPPPQAAPQVGAPIPSVAAAVPMPGGRILSAPTTPVAAVHPPPGFPARAAGHRFPQQPVAPPQAVLPPPPPPPPMPPMMSGAHWDNFNQNQYYSNFGHNSTGYPPGVPPSGSSYLTPGTPSIFPNQGPVTGPMIPTLPLTPSTPGSAAMPPGVNHINVHVGHSGSSMSRGRNNHHV